MSVFSVLGRFFTKAASVVVAAVGLGKQLAPLFRAARDLSPDIDRVLDSVENAVDVGGEAAGGWLADRAPALEAMAGFGRELAEFGRALDDMSTSALSYSADRELTPAEAELFAAKLNYLRACAVALGRRNDMDELLARF